MEQNELIYTVWETNFILLLLTYICIYDIYIVNLQMYYKYIIYINQIWLQNGAYSYSSAFIFLK